MVCASHLSRFRWVDPEVRRDFRQPLYIDVRKLHLVENLLLQQRGVMTSMGSVMGISGIRKMVALHHLQQRFLHIPGSEPTA